MKSQQEKNARDRAYYHTNKEKKLAQNKRWRDSNEEALWNARLIRLYGVDLDWYDQQLKKQNGLCGICKTPHPGTKKGKWNVDHDHTTGKVRGLLCRICNSMLGHAKDEVVVLQNAIDWIKNSGVSRVTHLVEAATLSR